MTKRNSKKRKKVRHVPRPQRFDVGDTGDDGERIIAITASEDDFIIYITEAGKSGFDCNAALMNNNKKEIETFDKVNSKIFNLLPRFARRFPATQLGYALSACFVYEDQSGLKLIENVEEYVDDKLDEIGRFSYLIAALLAFCTIILVFVVHGQLSQESSVSIQCGVLGALGSLISVLHRLSSVKHTGFASRYYVALQGSLRVVIGFIFGFLCYFLVKGNVIFGFLATSEYGIFLAAVVAGLNERIIPEILRRIRV